MKGSEAIMELDGVIQESLLHDNGKIKHNKENNGIYHGQLGAGLINDLGITMPHKQNLQKACNEKSGYVEDSVFLAVFGDMVGAHDFMFAVTSYGGLKSVRARSFYLRMMIEHIVDEILEIMGLSRANLIYSGGSRFCMLLPNTKDTEALLETARKNINDWLFENFPTTLYFELSWKECCADDLAESDEISNVADWTIRSILQNGYIGGIQNSNYCKLKQMFDTEKIENGISIPYEGTECCVCRIPKKELFKWERLHSMQHSCICLDCYKLYDIGKKLLELGSHPKEDGFMVAVSAGNINKEIVLALPGINGKRYCMEISKNKNLRNISNKHIRSYVVNGPQEKTQPSVGIRMANYCKKADCWEGNTLELEEPRSYEKHMAGVALMKAGIDGFLSSPIIHFAEIERKLSTFFKSRVDDLCCGKNNTNEKMFTLFDRSQKREGNFSVIYSDIDGVYIAGVWDGLVELVVNLRREFSELTKGTLTLSAGIAVFREIPAIYKMFEIVSGLYNRARENGAGSLCLADVGFGSSNETKHIYTWDEFENFVCADKLKKLMEWFCPNDLNNGCEIQYIGKTFLQSLITLLEKTYDRINPAKLAYVLAKSEPTENADQPKTGMYDEACKQIYYWASDKVHRKQLLTALMIMYNRGKNYRQNFLEKKII